MEFAAFQNSPFSQPAARRSPEKSWVHSEGASGAAAAVLVEAEIRKLKVFPRLPRFCPPSTALSSLSVSISLHLQKVQAVERSVEKHASHLRKSTLLPLSAPQGKRSPDDHEFQFFVPERKREELLLGDTVDNLVEGELDHHREEEEEEEEVNEEDDGLLDIAWTLHPNVEALEAELRKLDSDRDE